MVKGPWFSKMTDMEKFSIDNILKIHELVDEIEFEQASSLYLKLRWMVHENPSLEQVRNYLGNLMELYENKHWGDPAKITQELVDESDKAEILIEKDNLFIAKRKEIIKSRLNNNKLKQSDLAKILGHRDNYMSELINGIRPFSKEDIIVMNRLLKIPFKDLISPYIKEEVVKRIKIVLSTLKNEGLKFSAQDLETGITSCQVCEDEPNY